uniref:PGG domain-containing protein n=1 Tax=Oryza nivara TaxID=4536 RepID=A0A0E0J6H9_ORYNI
MAADAYADAAPPRRAPAPATSTVAKEAEFLWELRKYVLLLATLAATVTYTAGLDPPGGFWTDNVGELLAGDPVLQKTYPRRYKAFFYCNATAFVASLVIVNLLLVRFLCRRRWWLRALQAAMTLDMFGLMGAYAAGSSREAAMSAYILVLVILVCSYVSAHVLLYGLTTAQVSAPDAPERVERARKYLLIFATLAATVAYQAGLSTPGGFWLGSLENQHLAGDPMLRGNHPYRFMVFFYFNTTAFVASLVTIMLLMSRTVSRHGFRSSALWVCVGAAMVGLMGAFAAGSCRSFKTSIYVIALVGAVLLYIAIQFMVFISEPVKDWLHRAGETLQKCLKLDELEQRNQQQITLSNQGNGDAYLLLKKSRMYLLLLGILAASVAMILNLFGLIGAYAAGSCRQASKSVYVSVLVLPVFLYVGIHVLVFMLEVSPTWATWRVEVREKLKQCMPEWLKNLLELEKHVEEEEEEWKLEKRRKLLLLVAILAASLTYEAGMNPPGGFWQEKKSGDVGDPVLNNDNYRHRYLAFFFCNTTAFVASLAIIMLLVNRKLSARGIRSYALRVCVILVLVGLMGAFAAGSCRKVKTSIYVFVLVLAVLLCIAFQVALVVSGSLRRRRSYTAADGGDGEPRDLWDEKLPKYLLLLAALAAAVTYQAAMSPPGGLWDDGQTEHIVGDPVLLTNYARRYKVFFYCNATSFMASLVIMVLLLIKRVSNTQPALLALHAAMILDLFGLMGVYAAGSCRRVTTSAYILALLVGVSAYIVVLVVVSVGVARWMKKVMDKVGEKLTHCFSFEDL